MITYIQIGNLLPNFHIEKINEKEQYSYICKKKQQNKQQYKTIKPNQFKRSHEKKINFENKI
jgi:hypothetical protein